MPPLPFTAGIAPDKREAILDVLSDIERSEDVRVLFAVESGSRAWGFPSPDSDYDARFVYVRPLDWYLSLEPGRDVIERPIDDLLDVSGWDVKKALKLLLKPNAVMIEWLQSPIRYRWNDAACDQLLSLASKIKLGPAGTYHYFNLAERQWKLHLSDEGEIRLKTYFYVIRPALALEWLRLHPDTLPPMNFQALLKGVNPPADLVAALDTLLAAKRITKELGTAPRVPVIDAYIRQVFERTTERLNEKALTKALKAERARLKDEADAVFRGIVKCG